MATTAHGISVIDATAQTDEILTSDALDLLAELESRHGASRRALLERRAARAARLAGGEVPGLVHDTAAARADSSWRVHPAPADLVDRRCEITGPCDRKMMISALNSGARVFMADVEDALSPSWTNVIDAQRNFRDAADLSISFERPDGKIDRVGASPATMILRPRGLHLEEDRLVIGSQPMSASIVDAGLAAFHSAEKLQARGSNLYLYLPKLESHEEAAWWDGVLNDLEDLTGSPRGGFRVTVLIETILAAYEMEDIIYALRGRLTALNAGRWDYIFSVIKKFGHDPSHILPDRSSVTMTVPFMAAYAKRLVAVCHRRGAHAIGGMSAFIPNRSKPDVTARAIDQVRKDKEREALLGYDGTWVAHPDLVPVATAVFDEVLGNRSNQLEIVPELSDDVAALLETEIPESSRSRAGLRLNVMVALLYLEAWLDGRGAVAIFDLMEDTATAEISRSQLWQWVHHGVTLDDGTRVTRALVEQEIASAVDELAAQGHDRDRLEHSAALIEKGALSDELPDFLTLLARPA